MEKIINIGKALKEILIESGINSLDEMKKLGAENIFLKIKSTDNSACINKLYAIEGAIEGIRWHNIDKSRKQELKTFFDSL